MDWEERQALIERMQQLGWDLQSEAIQLQERLAVVEDKIEIVTDRLVELVEQNEMQANFDGY